MTEIYRFIKFTFKHAVIALVVMAAVAAVLRAIPSSNDKFFKGESCELQNKLIEVGAEKTGWDFIFVGTSKTYRQIIPEEFDKSVEGKSYNLGVKSNFPPRNWNLIEYLLSQDSQRNSTYVIELAPLNMIGANYKLLEINNAMSFGVFAMMLDYVVKLPLDLSMKIRYIFNYTRSILYKYTGLGLALDVRSWSGMGHESSKVCASDLVSTTRGFLSADAELELTHSTELTERNKMLDTQDDQSIAERFKTHKISFVEPLDFNDQLLKIARKIEIKGSKVIFVIPPRQGPNAAIAVNAQSGFLKAKGFKVLDYSDPLQYPQLYFKRNSFDLFHLNESGAEVYTALLAEGIMNEGV